MLTPDHIGDQPSTGKVGSAMVAVQGVSVLPFSLVTSMPTILSYGQIVRGASLEILIFTAVLLLLAFIEWGRRIAGALARAKEEAEEATRAKSSFLAMMIHEIRTPMNGLMSMVEMLAQTDLSKDQRSMSGVIRSSATALLTIINDILDFSKIEAGKLDVENTPFSLVDVAEGAGELVCHRAKDKGITLAVVVDPRLPESVLGDPTRIRQALINLMGNGVKFTETGGVTLKLWPLSRDTIRFEVDDTGIELTPEQQGRLFKAFEQADVSTSRKYGGTGLGLSISQRLSELMGGRIGVTSIAGKGPAFWMELPLLQATEAPPAGIDVSGAVVVGIVFFGPTARWLRCHHGGPGHHACRAPVLRGPCFAARGQHRRTVRPGRRPAGADYRPRFSRPGSRADPGGAAQPCLQYPPKATGPASSRRSHCRCAGPGRARPSQRPWDARA